MEALLVLLIALPAVFSEGPETWDPHFISCAGFPDGYHEAGCWGKAVCVNGEPVVTKCAAGQMFDYVTDACVSIQTNLDSTACNTPVDCYKALNGRHADLNDGCRSYYICLDGAFMGRMYCPSQTFFNEAMQICDYFAHVPAPCGSNTGVQTATPAGPYPGITGVVGK